MRLLRMLLRLAALVCLMLGVLAASFDSIQSVAAASVLLTPASAALSDLLAMLPDALRSLSGQVLAVTPAVVRDPVLAAPAFAVLFGFSLLFWMLGYRKPHPAGRFAA